MGAQYTLAHRKPGHRLLQSHFLAESPDGHFPGLDQACSSKRSLRQSTDRKLGYDRTHIQSAQVR